MNLLLIYIVVIGGVFIFMTTRGNRRRQTQAAQLQAALTLGAQVRTIGGLVGEVVEVTEEHVVIETTPGVRLKFIKSAIAGVVPPAEPESEAAEAEETEAAAEPEQTEPSDALPAAEAGAAGTETEAGDAHHVASEPANR